VASALLIKMQTVAKATKQQCLTAVIVLNNPRA
jgi:hypothetical protein